MRAQHVNGVPIWRALGACLLSAIVLSLLPSVMLPDTSGPMATSAGRALVPVVKALVLPPEWFRSSVLGQLQTYATYDGPNGGPSWQRPPYFSRMALRHATVAVPFWFTLLAVGRLLLRRFLHF